MFVLRCGRDVHGAVTRSAQAELRNLAPHVQVLVGEAMRARAAGRAPRIAVAAEGPAGRQATTLRWPPSLRDAVQAGAAADGRSFNMQVETLLREALWSRGIRLGRAIDDGRDDGDG